MVFLKKSVGVVVYRIVHDSIEVLLCHPGGPYWKNTDSHAWSFSKGERNFDERVVDTLKREFFEETNLTIYTDLHFLASRKVSQNKLVVMFYTCCDYDLSRCKSNTFELEFPKGSGNIQTFPEIDQYAWFDLQLAREKIFLNQIYFLDKLEEKICLKGDELDD